MRSSSVLLLSLLGGVAWVLVGCDAREGGSDSAGQAKVETRAAQDEGDEEQGQEPTPKPEPEARSAPPPKAPAAEAAKQPEPEHEPEPEPTPVPEPSEDAAKIARAYGEPDPGLPKPLKPPVGKVRSAIDDFVAHVTLPRLAAPGAEIPEKTIDEEKAPADDELPAPTDEEIAAWDRKDPAGEKHLYKWDKANLEALLGYWGELQCYRLTLTDAHGNAKLDEHLKTHVLSMDKWLRRLLEDNPRIIEKSKALGHFLELHELLMAGLPKALRAGGKELDKANAHWTLVEKKVVDHFTAVGAEKLEAVDDSDLEACQLMVEAYLEDEDEDENEDENENEDEVREKPEPI